MMWFNLGQVILLMLQSFLIADAIYNKKYEYERTILLVSVYIVAIMLIGVQSWNN